ncbi:menaquinone-dependent protoporphyrinogen IX dehydrogenase [Formosa sp. 3Alg 14/1]|uniref:menaquinone-dependent protoporphyrinogen IX dehydrogenase n=1 Tax=Formosa sp. 3Alg 14/1 TaxID=3382190 RepID=UPI0039BE0866
MEQHIGIIYSSVDGQTKKICENLSANFTERHISTKLCSIEDFNVDVYKFHTLIIGASIRYGKHNARIYEFVSKHKDYLQKIRTAFFSVNLVARNDNKNSPTTNPYLLKFINKTQWKPDYLDVFAGKLDYKSYPWTDRIMIRLIMKLTHGPTKSDKPIEFTDWKRVNDFSSRISEDYKITLN